MYITWLTVITVIKLTLRVNKIKTMKRILVIRYKFIGDVLMTSALCNSLKKSFPNSEVDYMVHAVSAPLFEHHPYIDNVIAVTDAERKNIWKYLRKAKSIGSKQYDIIIDTSSTAKTQLVSLFSRQTKYRIGREKKRKSFTFSTVRESGLRYSS